MLVNFNVTGDLANLLLSYLDANPPKADSSLVSVDWEVDQLSQLRHKLTQYNANSRMPFTDWWDALAVISRIYNLSLIHI